MRRIAIYGKGGIGKSTVSANVTASLCDRGLKVMQIGCDPKSDSTRLLLNGRKVPSVLESLREDPDVRLEQLVHEGYKGALCVECGGPKPGQGCAGRGIISSFNALERLGAIDEYAPDVIIYDVLGDVVCGGFAMPIRNNYAKDVFIVTSGEMMSLYAANNIAEAVNSFEKDGYAKLSGLIQNSRRIRSENQIVDKTALEIGTKVIARIARDPSVQRCESANMTVVEGEPDSKQANLYRQLADSLLNLSRDISGGMHCE